MVDVQLRRRVQELEDIVRGLLSMRGANNSPVQVAWQGNTPLLQFSKEDWFPVMITGYTPEPGTGSVSSVSGFYSGYELEVNFNADYGTATPGRTFAPSYQPLVELNNLVATSFPFKALARYRSTTVEVGPVYEFFIDGSFATAGLTVQTDDGTTHVYTGINTLEYPTADGALATNPATGVVKLNDASGSNGGWVNTTTQQFGGNKEFLNSVTVDQNLTVGLTDTLLYHVNAADLNPTTGYRRMNGSGTFFDQFWSSTLQDSSGSIVPACIFYTFDGTTYTTYSGLFFGRDGVVYNPNPLGFGVGHGDTRLAGGTITTAGGLTFKGGIYISGTPADNTLTVGTTTISGGTDGNFLVQSAGKLGEDTPAAADAALGTAAGAIADGTYGG